MNHFSFEDISIGQIEQFEFKIDDEKMSSFLNISEDTNPLHNDLGYAKKHGYNEKVVYGLLVASSLSKLAGEYLPGEKSLIYSIEINFKKPVFLSDCPLQVQGEVISKDERFSTIQIKFIIFNKSEVKVSRGTMTVGFVK